MAKNKQTKGVTNIKVRKPSFWLYTIPAYITRIFTKFLFRHKIDRSQIKGIKGPVVAISSHASTMDVFVGVHSMLPMRLNIVTGRDLFTWKLLKPFIKAFGAIPKSQNAVDISSMRTMKAAVEQGRNLLIYPEGKTSLDGKNLHYLSPSVAKFLKFLGCDVVMIKANGAYLTKPRYFSGVRRGKIVSKPYVLFTKEQLKTLSNKQIYDKVVEALQFNDHIWQQENNIRFTHKNTAGNLNYILYKCPKCEQEYKMVGEGKFLTCTHCQNKVEYTEYGQLKPIGDSVSKDRIDLWCDYQKQQALKELLQENFRLEHEVDLLIEDKQTASFVPRGEGIFFMDRENIGYVGSMDETKVELIQSVQQFSTIITKNKEGVDLMFDEIIHRFLFKDKKWSAKYGNMVEVYCAYRLENAKKEKLKQATKDKE